jgi:hypothetical protein
MTPPVDDFPCNLLVELITEYLDGAMGPDDARRLEQHLLVCAGCASAVEQFRVVLRVVGTLQESDVDRLARDQRESLMQAFREWSSDR